MFSTFRSIDSEPVRGSTHSAPRKRAQVRRACDGCRLARAKCDLTRPCRNCVQSGRECASLGVAEFKSVSSAAREVERLRERVRQLEEAAQKPTAAALEPSPATSVEGSSPDPSSSSIVASAVAASAASAIASPIDWRWKGIAVDGLRYGPVSLRYFIERVSRYMGRCIGPPAPPVNVLSARNVDLRGCDLTRQQQDFFVEVFYTAYHTAYPVVDEADFGRLYSSLWDEEGVHRRADPLVDVVLAVGIQYAFSLMGMHDPTPRPRSEHAGSASNGGNEGEEEEDDRPELSVAGSPFYHRSRAGLDDLTETPSVKTVQCMYLGAMYLSYARCYNAAHAAARAARHTASSLAVDEACHATNRCLLTRTARCLRVLDSRLSLRLGRVLRVPASLAAPLDASRLNPDNASSVYHDQLLLLCELAEDVYRSFMERADALFDASRPSAHGRAAGAGVGGGDMYTDQALRNRVALIMRDQMERLTEWTAQVPPPLRLHRDNSNSNPKSPKSAGAGPARPFSTDQPHARLRALDEPDVPVWLQRHRITLECHYHDVCVQLLRLFICFSPVPLRGARDADLLCLRCLDHAVSLTSILDQASASSTEVIRGCFQAYEWQESATYALAGFAIAYPTCPATVDARRALHTATSIFRQTGSGTPAAVRMTRLCSLLDSEIAHSVSRLRDSLGAPVPTPAQSQQAPTPAPSSEAPDATAQAWEQGAASQEQQGQESFPLLYASPDWGLMQAELLNDMDWSASAFQ